MALGDGAGIRGPNSAGEFTLEARAVVAATLTRSSL